MAELLGIEKIIDILNEFLAPFDVTADLGTDFAYYPNFKIIDFALVESVRSHKEFMTSIEKWNPAVKLDSFVWSILHELGHHVTFPKIPKFQHYFCNYVKIMIEKGLLPRLWYYSMTDELRATKWAVQFANTHIEELRTLWEKLYPAIMEFYTLNNVEL